MHICGYFLTAIAPFRGCAHRRNIYAMFRGKKYAASDALLDVFQVKIVTVQIAQPMTRKRYLRITLHHAQARLKLLFDAM